MKRPVGLAVTLVSLTLGFSSGGVGAAPIACPEPPEIVHLAPLAAFVDGGEVFRNTSGRYATDAGFEFDVESVDLRALPGMRMADGCAQASASLSADVLDPFTGAAHTLVLEVSP